MKKLITLVMCLVGLTAAAGTNMTIEQCVKLLLSQSPTERLQAGANAVTLETLTMLIDEKLAEQDDAGAPARVNAAATDGSVDDAMNQVVDGSKRLPVVNDRIEQQRQQ